MHKKVPKEHWQKDRSSINVDQCQGNLHYAGTHESLASETSEVAMQMSGSDFSPESLGSNNILPVSGWHIHANFSGKKVTVSFVTPPDEHAVFRIRTLEIACIRKVYTSIVCVYIYI